MLSLSANEIIAMIKDQKIFEATAIDDSFRIKINRYVPYCCAAIHDGGNIRESLRNNIRLDDYERWYEEDPHTGKFIDSMPITITGQDSRFEYDLNRAPEDAIYEEAWGKKVWKKPLTSKERQLSLKKHEAFYKVIDALIQKLEELFDSCVVYDIHSYNYQRWDRVVPLFNVGTENIDRKQFGSCINHWLSELKTISLNGIENITAENDVFYGRGYFLKHIANRFDNSLVLATEVKKVYSNELTGEDYPKVIKEIQQKLKQAIITNAHFFSKHKTNWEMKLASNLLDKKSDPELLKVDKTLYRLLKNFELLAYVNPTNNANQRKTFIQNNFSKLPRFKYSPIKINPFELKQQLSQLRVQDISDISIRHMYESVVNSYLDKIDLLGSLNTTKFLYNSLRYFGRPSKRDLQNAEYLLALPAIPSEPNKVPYIPFDSAVEAFKAALEHYGIEAKIEFSDRVISQVMVLNSKRTILFRPDAKFTAKDVHALIEHEIGVHMVTTQNSAIQNLKVFNLGLPVNTETQEGLAILAEYLSGNITLKRLKKLAHRVVIVDMMCSGANFIECFNNLHHQHDVPANDAFTIVTRAFRGGGFTKDYLYLSGFVKILKLWNEETSLDPLLVGKTSLDSYRVISEMIERELVQKPKYITHSFHEPNLNGSSEIYNYIISGLK
ncbi:MAG: flavohemoglobin expression-modulating QEGLA motif protein [Bacteroidia bacterium]|nr:flavohemoglobin expression-modulating QEGLA motif protein [Bacteroidia bacterium]